MEIIGLYTKDLMAMYSINQISKSLDKKYPYINKKVTALIQAGIFRKIEIGRSYLCSLNLQNPRTIILLSLYYISKQSEFPWLTVKLQQQLKTAKKQHDIASLIFSQNKILVIIPESTKKDGLLESLPKIEGIKYEIISRHQFSELILSNKSVYSDHFILYGYEKFYEMIEDIENKLKVSYSPIFKNG